MANKIKYAIAAVLALFAAPFGRAYGLVPCVTSADITTLSELFKQVYDPMIEEQQNLSAVTWNEFSDGDDPMGGQGWYFETRMGGNQEGIGARQERGTLPAAGRQRWKQGIITEKYCYGTFEITGPAIARARSNVMAFANARTEEIEGLTRDVIKDFNRMIFGDGTGALCTCTGANTAAVVNVNDGLYLRLNMMVDVWDAGTPTTKNGDSLQIIGLAPQSNGTMDVTFDATPGTALASGDVLIREDNAYVTGGARVSNEMMGLQGIIDDGTLVATFENITRSSYPLFKGHVFDNSGTDRNLTLDLLQQVEDMVNRATGERPDWNRMNFGQRRKFVDLVAPERRYMDNNFKAGFEELSYNGLSFKIDIDCPKGMIFMGRKSTIKKYATRKFGILDTDGQVLRQVTGQDLWRGHLGIYGNLGSKRPAANAKLTDLQEPIEEQWVS